MLTTIAFDADDTLWHNERIFLSTKDRFTALLADYHDPVFISRHLDATESKNIRHFGYGIKGFTLSMIETACELTEGRITGDRIREIVGFGKEMLAAPIEVFDGVRETLESLKGSYLLMVVTKGDLLDQESKIARSGLGELFDAVEIVADKDASTYARILGRRGIEPGAFLMVGNSLRSDILPVLEAGANAVFVPYETEWFHERVSDEELAGKSFGRIESLRELPEWLEHAKRRISADGAFLRRRT